jgi:dienelactone hydrolase
MFRKIEHTFAFLGLVILASCFIAMHFFGFSFQFLNPLLAKIPGAVGNKPAPVPVMLVEHISMGSEKNISQSQIRQSISSAVSGKNITPKYALKEYLLQWQVSVEDGTLAAVRAQVFVPTSKNNEQFPVIIYGPGSTGLADRCAPSRENLRIGNMGNYRNYMIAEASQGFIVVMPNYEGFDNPDRNQHYFNKDNEARTMLSAAKAALIGASQFNIPVKPTGVFLGGYSQGGHAAFSAADYADTYVPDVKIAGVFGHGPTTDIFELLKRNPNLAAYFVASYSEYYPVIVPDKILEKEWVGYLDRARTICVNEGFGINSTTIARTYADTFEKALVQNTIARNFPDMNAVFVENSSGTSYKKIPTMIVQGTADPIVTTQAQDTFVQQICKRGVAVDYKKYSGVHHFDTRRVSFDDTNAWITAVSQGKTVTNSCTSLR